VDVVLIAAWIGSSSYDVRADHDLDFDVDSADKAAADGAALSGASAGRTVLSFSTGNRQGFSGATHLVAGTRSLLRQRILDSRLGRWLRRDPIMYGDGGNLVEYVRSLALTRTDSTGLASEAPSQGILDCNAGLQIDTTTDQGWTLSVTCQVLQFGNCSDKLKCKFGCLVKVMNTTTGWVKDCPKRDGAIDYRELNANPHLYPQCYQWHGGGDMTWDGGGHVPGAGQSENRWQTEVPCDGATADIMTATSPVDGGSGVPIVLSAATQYSCGPCRIIIATDPPPPPHE